MIKRINNYFFDESFTSGDIAFYWGMLGIGLVFAIPAIATAM